MCKKQQFILHAFSLAMGSAIFTLISHQLPLNYFQKVRIHFSHEEYRMSIETIFTVYYEM